MTSGGCGSQSCTGPNNYFIQDNDGGFLGVTGQLLANNSWIGGRVEKCRFIARVNGYLCENTGFGVMEYESVARD